MWVLEGTAATLSGDRDRYVRGYAESFARYCCNQPAQKTNSTEHRATTRVAPTEAMAGEMDPPTTNQFALGDVIGAYKSLTTVEYARGVKQMKWSPFHKRLWQRNYYEHVVRHDESLQQLQQYLLDNPDQWAFDKENPLAERPETEKL